MEEKEKSKGISLRKKKSVRPKISAPQPISAPLPTGISAPSISEERSRPSESSSRLDVPREPGAPPVPSVPAIPGQFQTPPASRDGKPAASGGQRIKVDAQALRDPNLQPEQYVASLLTDADEQDIRNYQDELRKLKNRTSTDLQANVYQNRTQFIKISKEAEKLWGEMRTLRTWMSELTGALAQTTSAAADTPTDTVDARKRANRSSVANLEAMWSTHLQQLWRRVEGSQKYLPAIPGRHVVYESSRWVELNAATWKTRQRVHLILLNDHLLVASVKKRTDISSPNIRDNEQKQDVQLTAERCWPLQDVKLADLSTAGAASDKRDRNGERQRAADAVNVRVGSESFTFAATGSSASSDRAALVTTFRKTVEDLRRSQEAETDERRRTQELGGQFATKKMGVLNGSDSLENQSDSVSQRPASILVDVEGKQQSLRWVESQLDDLDIDIALHHFEDAVARTEKLKRIAKGNRGNAAVHDTLTSKVNERATKLAGLISKELTDSHAWKTSTQKNVSWLSRLGFEDRAREVYLDARSSAIEQRCRQCIFEGNLHDYIYEISFIYFTIIQNTVKVYAVCFPAPMMSACVKWAKEHVDDFNVILERQLSSLPEGSPKRDECLERAREHGRMLAEVGLDFKDLIGRTVEERSDNQAAEFLWLCLKESGYKKIDHRKVGEAMNITGNASSLRFMRLRKAVAEGKPVKNEFYGFLKLCIANSDVGKIDFAKVGAALGITQNAASLRYMRLRKKAGDDQGNPSPAKSAPSTPVKKTPVKIMKTPVKTTRTPVKNTKTNKTPNSKRKRVQESDAEDDIIIKNDSGEDEAKDTLMASSPPSATRVLRDRSSSAKPKYDYASESGGDSDASEWKGDSDMTTPSKKKQKTMMADATGGDMAATREPVTPETAVKQEMTAYESPATEYEPPATQYELPATSYGEMVGLGDSTAFFQPARHQPMSFINYVDGEEVFYDAETGDYDATGEYDTTYYSGGFQEEYV
ncbi:exocyst complex component exo84 [Coniosporium tulheliwenetii]|uniref:Exocyst complex component exo84 n=1 Tax=Coniosporium tulheliwenetii TaxID=3383036 RepID=A0ACC2ZBJ0_9PEZI|nr:exocyst complex component exo84 [Cladosporium sp. JES 115]